MIEGLGSVIPDSSITSADTEERLALERGWIERRTGVRVRRVVEPSQATSDLATEAARRALVDARMDPGRIGLVLLATSTPDHLLPPTAPLVAHQLGAFSAGAIDIAGACTGFVAALVLGAAHARTACSPVLVIAANVLSRRVDPDDAMTNALFADGAGAVVIGDEDHDWLLGSALGADGRYADAIRVPAGGSRYPSTAQAVENGDHFMRVERGSAMAHEAILGMVWAGRESCKAGGLDPAEVDLWVPHQAGRRIVEGARERLHIDGARTVDVVADLGNSSAATIPMALDIARADGRLGRGSTVLLTAVGAGLVKAGAVIRW